MKIRHRIVLWITGAGLVTSLVFSLVIFIEMVEQPFEIMDDHMKTTARFVAQELSAQPQAEAALRLDAYFAAAWAPWVRVYDGDLWPVYQSPLAKAVDLPLEFGRGAYMTRIELPGKGAEGPKRVWFRIRVFERDISGARHWVQVAGPMEELEDEILDLAVAFAIGLLVSTGLLVYLSHVLAGRIVEPIAAINRLAREITEKTLDKRIPLGKTRDEIYELSECLNHMFDRIQLSFARQKRFLADASHELKSPIAMLRLFFEDAALRTDLPESFQKRLESQGRNLLRMDRLVRSLMELSVLEANPSLKKETFDLSALALSVLEDMAPVMEREGIRLEREIPEELTIHGDRDRIRRMLINILDNAVKYNEKGGLVRLWMTAEGAFIKISLSNTGLGIPKEDLEKVFEQFYRVERSRATGYGGAGLGLSIVREIVRLHGGTVGIESEPGGWTRITITLPKGIEA
ncbi:MAG: HAMP domain-containing histidine kinase [Deltaproteobacteria bacterium]